MPSCLPFSLFLLISMPVLAKETLLPPVADSIGVAGGFAGLCDGHLVAGGGANFPGGVMPWDGGEKVWHDQLFSLDLEQPGAGWREIGNMPASNGYGVSLTLEDGVLIIGGGNAVRNFRKVLLLGLSQGKPVFRKFPDLPVTLAQMTGALVGRHVHLYGGLEKPDSASASSSHWMLDLDLPGQGWKAVPPLPGAGRILATSAGVGDAFIVIGGCSLAPDASGKPVRTYLREAWKYAGGKWHRLADPPRAATAAASPAPVRGDALFVISGDDGTAHPVPAAHPGFTREILRYDLSDNAWSVAGKLEVPAPVTLPAVPWKDGYILFNGEVRPGVRTPQVILFTPPANEP